MRKAVHAGSCVLSVKTPEMYIPAQLILLNSGWHSEWFYLRNDDDLLPRFSG